MSPIKLLHSVPFPHLMTTVWESPACCDRKRTTVLSSNSAMARAKRRSTVAWRLAGQVWMSSRCETMHGVCPHAAVGAADRLGVPGVDLLVRAGLATAIVGWVLERLQLGLKLLDLLVGWGHLGVGVGGGFPEGVVGSGRDERPRDDRRGDRPGCDAASEAGEESVPQHGV